MKLKVNNTELEIDEEDYLLNPEDWDEDVALALIAKHEADGHKKVTETGWELIRYFREYYEDHMMHPSMHRLLKDREKVESKVFNDEKSYREFLYELFSHGPINMLCKLAGLPKPSHEMET